ncbi:MAG: CPBP family intramembrane metalloprotease [Clostridia bacterium]|nr:CPBP family intramembrane metalloprotease [Clostridia bacterium]
MNKRLFRDVILPAAFYAFLLYASQLLVGAALEIIYVASQTGQNFADAVFNASETLLAHASLVTLAGDALALFAVYIISRIKKVSFTGFTDINGRISLKVVFLMLVAGFACNLWISFLLTYLPIPESAMGFYEEASGFIDEDSVMAVVVSVLVAPVVEEVFFRGLIYKHFRICMPEYAAVVLQALVFASFHGPSVVWMSYALLVGLLFGYVRMLTEGIRACIMLHAAFNAASYLLDPLIDSPLITVLLVLSPLLLILSVYSLLKQTNG